MDEKTIIFAPHPDDEILGCYQIIKDHPEAAYIVYLTNGDYEGRDMARIRWAESRAALAHLGVPEDHMIALGYADTGMAPEISFLWRLWHDETGVVLPSANAAETWHPADGQEYALTRTGAHAPYTRQSVLDDLTALLTELRPGTIYIPNEFEAHGDHAAAAVFVSTAVEAILDYHPMTFRYHLHGGDDARWPARTGAYFTQPMNLPDSQWDIRLSVPVTDRADLEYTLRLFASQVAEDEPYMMSFVKDEQLYYPPVFHCEPDEA